MVKRKRVAFSKERLPRKYGPYSTGRVVRTRLGTKKTVVECALACGKCIAITQTGKRCSRRVCTDFRYCKTHLANVKHLTVAPSRHVPGTKGLYAVSSARYEIDGEGAPVEKHNIVVFRKGDIIDRYGGESMTKRELDLRYDDRADEETAPYAMSLSGGAIVDAFCARTAPSYSNDSTTGIAAMMAKPEFGATYDKLPKTSKDNMTVRGDAFIASRNIHHGEELLWRYGSDYWNAKGMRKLLAHQK